MQQFFSFLFFAFKGQRVMEKDEEISRSPFFRLKREREREEPLRSHLELVFFFSFYTGGEINF